MIFTDRRGPLELFLTLSVVFSLILICKANENTDNALEQCQSLFEGGVLRHLAKNIQGRDSGNSEDCKDDLDRWWEMKTSELWAMEMLDSGGRPPHGILKGNFNSVGQFEECIAVSHKRNDSSRTIRGKYCLAKIPLPAELLNPSDTRALLNVNNALQTATQENNRVLNVDGSGAIVFNLALCMPASCKASDVETILQGTLAYWNISSTISIPSELCSMDEPKPWSAGEIVSLCFFGLVGVVLFLSTLYDLWFVLKKGEKGSARLLLTSFSLYTNARRLTTLSKDPGPLACLHGIRVLSMFWIILGHRYTMALMFPVENLFGILDWMETYWSMAVVAATVSVDTFFLLSGVLLSYTFFRQTKNRSLKEIPMFYFHRYLRLTPALAVMILLQITIIPKIGRGPFWSQLNNDLVENCREYWWSTLLYVQNYVNNTDFCVGQSWYLSVDMQLYILSPIILYPILKHAKIGLTLAVGWIVASLISVFVICYTKAWYAASMPLSDPNADSRMSDYYVATQARATPWLIGVFAGYFLRAYVSKDVKINKVLVVLGWLASLAVMGAVILGMQPLQSTTHQFSYLEDTTYLAFSRTAWAVAVLWVIVACFFGYGGPVNWLLSLRMWEFLARLTYSMYLIHMTVQNILISGTTTIGSFSHLSLAHLFLGDLITTTVLSFFMVLIFESPITVLEKLIFKTAKPKTASSQEQLVIDPERQNTSEEMRRTEETRRTEEKQYIPS